MTDKAVYAGEEDSFHNANCSEKCEMRNAKCEKIAHTLLRISHFDIRISMTLTAGILTHNDAKYLRRCLETLTAQNDLGEIGKGWQIVVLDNASDDRGYLEDAKQEFPEVTVIFDDENNGFAKGHNKIINQFPANYHAVLNNDVLFAPDFLSKLVKALEDDDRYSSSTGKLLRWDFENDAKTDFIDTVGIGVTKAHRFFDIGQGEQDLGQFDERKERFGGSGAAVLYRRSDIEKIVCPTRRVALRLHSASLRSAQDDTAIFDESFFMYKEDCDLAERLIAIGKPCIYIPDARAWHDRTANSLIKRSERSERERIGSAAHQTMIIRKHLKWLPWPVRVRTVLYDLMRWGYLLVREPKVFWRARRLLGEKSSKTKMRVLHSVGFKEVRRFF